MNLREDTDRRDYSTKHVDTEHLPSQTFFISRPDDLFCPVQIEGLQRRRAEGSS